MPLVSIFICSFKIKYAPIIFFKEVEEPSGMKVQTAGVAACLPVENGGNIPYQILLLSAYIFYLMPSDANGPFFYNTSRMNLLETNC